eukprot:gene35303-42775_t
MILVVGLGHGRLCQDGLVRHRYVARVSYDGSAYKGWQQQASPKAKTIQGLINQNLSKRLCREVRITGASRTDQGVHARGQGIHFDLLDHEYLDTNSIDSFQFNLNSMLPKDIRVYNMSIAPPGNEEQVLIGEPFHATKSAIGKKYVYKYCTNQYVEPVYRHIYAHFYRKYDYSTLPESLQCFVGTHDFTCFGNRVDKITKSFESKTQPLEYDTIRTIYSIDHIDEGGGYYRIEFHIKSALYKMIRNLVGTCVSAAKGRITKDDIVQMLENPTQRVLNPAVPAPAEGLILERVLYKNY